MLIQPEASIITPMDRQSQKSVRRLAELVAMETGLRSAEVEEALELYAADRAVMRRVIWMILRVHQVESEMLGRDRN